MKLSYGLERMDLVNCAKGVKKRKVKEWHLNEDYLIRCLNNALLKDLSKDVKTFEEFKNSKELQTWLKENAPEGYDFQKGMYEKGNLISNNIGEKDFDNQKENVSLPYLKNYMRSAGYENLEEAEIDVKKLAKTFNVNEYTIRKLLDRYFKAEEMQEYIYRIRKEKDKER